MPSKKRYLYINRVFEKIAGNSRKFWQVVVQDNVMATFWGRLESKGQQKAKPFKTDTLAITAAYKKIDEKSRSGYGEVSNGSRDQYIANLKEVTMPTPTSRKPAKKAVRRSKAKPKVEVVSKKEMFLLPIAEVKLLPVTNGPRRRRIVI